MRLLLLVPAAATKLTHHQQSPPTLQRRLEVEGLLGPWFEEFALTCHVGALPLMTLEDL